MSKIALYPTKCAICGTENNAAEVYRSRFDDGSFDPAIFSARRSPDRVHYRIVRCKSCGLVRSDPTADANVASDLYRQSSFNYAPEVENLNATYARYLKKVWRYSQTQGSLLEIGCGAGFFLEEARRQGYQRVAGVEPSERAVAAAAAGIRNSIVCSIMRPGLFAPGLFDTICLFQTLDHMDAPGALLDECFRLLKPGGCVMALNHNIRSLPVRVLAERSPVIDIEHTYLYSPETMTRLFIDHGFRVRERGTVFNRYTMRYLVHLSPLPAPVKRIFIWITGNTALGGVRVRLPIGNMYIIAQKT